MCLLNSNILYSIASFTEYFLIEVYLIIQTLKIQTWELNGVRYIFGPIRHPLNSHYLLSETQEPDSFGWGDIPCLSNSCHLNSGMEKI